MDLTKNLKYDRLTKKVISMAVTDNSTCVDVGCHKGEILDLLIKQSPNKKHFGFEPIPDFYDSLKAKYKNHNIFNFALADKEGETTFNYVKNAPAYSGILKREYKVENPEVQELTVPLKTLDSIIPETEQIDFVKIDVEGGEYNVLKGAERILTQNKPIVIFEFGLGASNFYGTSPNEVFSFLKNLGFKISLLDKWIKKLPSLTEKEFEEVYAKNSEYYFIAYS